jgi:hypothetical protein
MRLSINDTHAAYEVLIILNKYKNVKHFGIKEIKYHPSTTVQLNIRE